MSRGAIIGVIAAVLLVGGAAAYVITRNDDEPTGNQTNTSEQTDDHHDDDPVFNPISTEGRDFEATFSGSQASGSSSFEYDADNKAVRFIAAQGDNEIETITTPDAYYARTGDEWIKYPVASSTFDAESYQYDEQELGTYQNSAASHYAGVQDCSGPSGSCHVWEFGAGSETTIYLDTGNGYIVKVISMANGQISTVEYDYKPVTITPPTEFKELPAFN